MRRTFTQIFIHPRQTPSSARDPLIALFRPLSNLKRDRTLGPGRHLDFTAIPGPTRIQNHRSLLSVAYGSISDFHAFSLLPLACRAVPPRSGVRTFHLIYDQPTK